MTKDFARAMIVIQGAKRAIKDAKRAATPGVHGQALLVKNPLTMRALKAYSQVAKAKVTLPAHHEIAGSSGLDLVIVVRVLLARVLLMGVHLAMRDLALLIVSQQVIVSHGANGLDLVIAGVMAKGHISDQGHHSVIDHPAVNVRRLVIGLRARKVIAHPAVNVRHSVIDHHVLIAHVLTGTAHPWTLKAEKNIPREHLGNVRLNALALGRDRARESVRALVKGHASEQGPHQVIDGLAVKGAASAIDRQEVGVRRAAIVHHAQKDEALVIARNTVVAPKEVTVLHEVIVHHAQKDEALVIARHAVIAPKEVTVLREVIVHHAQKDEALVIARHAVIVPKEVTVLREVIVHHAVKDEALVIAPHAVIAPKEMTVLREVIVHHAVKDVVLVIAHRAAQNVPGASALIPEVHGAAPDPSTLDIVRLKPVRRTRAGTPSTVYGMGVPGVIQRPVTLLWNEKDSSRSDSPPHTQPGRLHTRQGPAPCADGIRRGHDQAGVEREPVRSVAARGGSDPRCRAGREFLS
jgi:sRNA-binding carbon storage regulator CsrA